MVTCQSRVSLSSSPIWIPSPLLAMLLFRSFLSATHMETNSIYLWHWTLYINASPVFTYHKYSYIYLYDSLTYIIHIVSTSSIISLYPIYIYIYILYINHIHICIYLYMPHAHTYAYIHTVYTYYIYTPLVSHVLGSPTSTWLVPGAAMPRACGCLRIPNIFVGNYRNSKGKHNIFLNIYLFIFWDYH